MAGTKDETEERVGADMRVKMAVVAEKVKATFKIHVGTNKREKRHRPARESPWRRKKKFRGPTIQIGLRKFSKERQQWTY